MPSHLLAVEVGNSRIKAGLFSPATDDGLPSCLAATAFSVRRPDPADLLGRWLGGQDILPEAALLAGTNPRLIKIVRDGWQERWGELLPLDRPSPAILVNRTDAPDRVGPDRLFDAVAANRLRPSGAPAVVVDSGTATTVNVIDADGAFLGGAIIAGFELIATALHERTAALPRIDVTNLDPPPDPLGRNTDAALRSGLYWTLVGGVKELVARLSADSPAPPLLLLTGGAAPLLVPHLPHARHEPCLTLQGMILTDFHANRSERPPV
jgi:type III pantothenate kinase